MYIKEIETTLKPFEVFKAFSEDKGCFFLDSGMDPNKLGRYSFIGSQPFLLLKSKNKELELEENGVLHKEEGNPFIKLRELIKPFKFENTTELPFIGGAVGYLSYDLCHHIEKLKRDALDDVSIPDCFMGFYDGIIAFDHMLEKTYAVALGIHEPAEDIVIRLIDKVSSCKASKEPITTAVEKEFRSNFTKEDYMDAVNKVRGYIRNGDIYQANLTQRFSCDIKRTPIEIYNCLRTVNPAPFAAYVDFEEGCVLSSSPERFIKIRNRRVETRPIKGTRPRGANPEEDRINRQELLASEKDKSELLMIVDLERNDIGRVSKPGSVAVTELFHLEEYATVYHLVSTIIGDIKDDCDELDCIMSTFPGGSITGAPKIRAMEIIDELEPTQRNVYTGSIGYIGFDGSVDLNIAIRTIVTKEDKAYFQVGGGIVWDSDPEEEYQETLHKGKALFKALSME